MDKIWFRNNLSAMGKGGGASLLFGIVITAFVFGFGGNLPLRAYASDPIQETYLSTEFQLDLTPINQVNEITAPVNNLIDSAMKSLRFDQVINIGTGIPLSRIKNPSQNIDFSKFFSSSTVSSNDIMSFLKEAAITGINLSILIISITAQVLKGVLSVIKQ